MAWLQSKAGRQDDAIQLAEQALNLAQEQAQPKAHVLDTLAVCHFRKGSTSQAKIFLERSLDRYPTPISHLHLSQILTALNLPQQAKKHATDARRLAAQTNTCGPAVVCECFRW